MLTTFKASKLTKVVLAALPLVLASQVQAADGGTIDFTGNVTANTCNIAVAGTALTAPNSASITLDSVNNTSLLTAGAVAGTKAFSIAVSGCLAGNNSFITLFTPLAADVTPTGKLINKAAGGANNVVLEILNSTNTAVNLFNSTPATQQGTTLAATSTITNGSGTQNYKVQYLATGVAGPGAVSASLPFTLSYQ